MTRSDENYAASFRKPSIGEAYDRFYQLGTADQALWEIERDFLAALIDRTFSQTREFSYLDFACGTGRVISFVESRATRSRGIDTSAEMLRIAAQKVHRSELICTDITQDGATEETYDLITAFRFFLNAEPSLRLAAMKALSRRLKNRQSMLVFTNHGNPYSYKALFWPYHQMRRWRRVRSSAGNYLTHSEVAELLSDAGLELVERHGCGFVSPKLFHVAPQLAKSLEQWLASSGLFTKLGVNQIYVVQHKATNSG